MQPKLSKAAHTLRDQVNAAFPNRDKASDGWLGDSRHAARVSDHNPDEQGWVRAIDIDVDLFGKDAKPKLMPDFADQLRAICASKAERRIAYIIFNKRIAGKPGWAWRKYSSFNGHTHHMHVSFEKEADLLDKLFEIPMLGADK